MKIKLIRQGPLKVYCCKRIFNRLHSCLLEFQVSEKWPEISHSGDSDTPDEIVVHIDPRGADGNDETRILIKHPILKDARTTVTGGRSRIYVLIEGWSVDHEEIPIEE